MNLQTKLCNVAIVLGLAMACNVNTAGAHARKLTQTIDIITPTKDLVDVYLLADNTGSMRCAIDDVKANALRIFEKVKEKAPNVAFGVGAYKDVDDNFVFKSLLPITDLDGRGASISKAINQWEAQGGGDTPEAQLFALHQIAVNAQNQIKWRPRAKKIIVWFGDQPGHDPRKGISEAVATKALLRMRIQVVALDVGSLDGRGQATRIAQTTSGTLFQIVGKCSSRSLPPPPCGPVPIAAASSRITPGESRPGGPCTFGPPTRGAPGAPGGVKGPVRVPGASGPPVAPSVSDGVIAGVSKVLG